MGTSYKEIYERFLNKIEDFEIMENIIEDADFAERMMLGYLKSAISKYVYNTQDYSQRDDTSQEFYLTLSELEKEILAILMVVEYLSPKMIRLENIEQRLGSSDFKQYSPANLLKELQNIKKSTASEANDLMVLNYFRDGH